MAEDAYAGAQGRFYRSYIRHPAVARVVGSLLWGSDFRPLYRHLERLRHLPPGTTVVDAACGAGLTLGWLDPARGHRYVGVDLSPTMLAHTRRVGARRGFTRLETHQGDIASIPLADGEADVGLCYNAVHCLADPQAAINEVVRCLAPGGELLGSSLVRGGSARADRLLSMDPSMGPGGSRHDLRRWLERSGLHAVEVQASKAMATFSARR